MSIADTVSRLEQEYQILLPLQQDFDLVGRIEDLWKAQNQSVNTVSRHKKKHYEKAANNDLINRINRLYKKALISHGIENYKDSIKDSIELAIDAHDMVKLNFMCRNITENTRAEAIFYALFKDKT